MIRTLQKISELFSYKVRPVLITNTQTVTDPGYYISYCGAKAKQFGVGTVRIRIKFGQSGTFKVNYSITQKEVDIIDVGN